MHVQLESLEGTYMYFYSAYIISLWTLHQVVVVTYRTAGNQI